MSRDDFCLKWNDHHSIFFSSVEQLCAANSLTDVTLSCGNRQFSAHKLVLSVCSSYFSSLFSAPKHDPRATAIVYLKDVSPHHMELLLSYMYRGEINVQECELVGLLATAKGLQIKGLTEASEDDLAATTASESDEKHENSSTNAVPKRSHQKSGSNSSSKSSSSSKRHHQHQQSDSSSIVGGPEVKRIKEEWHDTASTGPGSSSTSQGQQQQSYQGGDGYGDDGYAGGGGGSGGAGGGEADEAGDDGSYPPIPEGGGPIITEEQYDQNLTSVLGGVGGAGSPAGAGAAAAGAANGPPPKKVGGVARIDERHVCLECGKGFGHRWMLDRHSLTHTGVQRFACARCHRRFSLQASVVRHLKNVHKEPTETQHNISSLVYKFDENNSEQSSQEQQQPQSQPPHHHQQEFPYNPASVLQMKFEQI